MDYGLWAGAKLFFVRARWMDGFWGCAKKQHGVVKKILASPALSPAKLSPQGGGKNFFSRPHDAYGWMDFDAAQKINLDTQDGLWNLMPCQKNNISSITCLNHGSHSRCWRCCSPFRGSSRRCRPPSKKKAKTAANAAADKKSAADLRESSRMDVGGG